MWGGGGGWGSNYKKDPPGKTQDVLCLFCSFLFFFVLFQNTFKIDVFVPNLVKNVSSKKNKKDHNFCLFCSFCRISLTKFPQTENKKEQQDHAAGKIAKCSLSFLLSDPPPPPSEGEGHVYINGKKVTISS